LWGFVPLGIIGIKCMSGCNVEISDWLICLGILVFIAAFCILIPENIMKEKDSPYKFASTGYFDKYL